MYIKIFKGGIERVDLNFSKLDGCEIRYVAIGRSCFNQLMLLFKRKLETAIFLCGTVMYVTATPVL